MNKVNIDKLMEDYLNTNQIKYIPLFNKGLTNKDCYYCGSKWNYTFHKVRFDIKGKGNIPIGSNICPSCKTKTFYKEK